MRNKQGANCTDEYYITYHINMEIALKSIIINVNLQDLKKY